MKINFKSQKDNKQQKSSVCQEETHITLFRVGTWLEYKATCYSDITDAANHLFVSVNTLLLTVITVCLADILWFSDVEEKAHWSDSETQKFPRFPPLTFGLQCAEGWNNLSELQRWDRSKGSSISLEALEVCRKVAGWVFFINSQHSQFPMVFSCLF